MISLIIRVLVIIGIVFLFTKVTLTPDSSREYFFFSSDPALQGYNRVASMFPPKESLVLIVKSKTHSVYSGAYYQQIRKLTNKILATKGVESVYSLSHGPKDVMEASNNLVWRAIIFGESNNSTLITSAVNKKINPHVIEDFEKLVKENKLDAFEIKFSGTPYILESIKRYTYKDLKDMAIVVLTISFIMIVLFFRSLPVLLGAFVTTIAAILSLIMLTQFFKIPFGILSPNLLLVIFLITQAQIIFLTSNYFKIGDLKTAIKRTLPASFATVLAIFLCFVGLVRVPVKPLAEFGFVGMIGAVVALVFAYLIYPVSLKFVHPPINQKPNFLISNMKSITNKPRYLSVLFISACCIFFGLNIVKLNIYPTIYEYFAKGTQARLGAIVLDLNGGSSTLRLIVSHPRLVYLDNAEAFQAMDALQNELANHKKVGTVVSLPLLMKEAKNSSRIAKFLPWHILINILSSDHFDRIATRFMTHDRKQALFILRMKESQITEPRAEIIKDIEKIVNKHGFHVDLKGGPYPLQSQLEILLKSSLQQILPWLFISSFVIISLASRSIIIAMTMSLGLLLMILGTLGIIGFTGTIVEVISFPAIVACFLLALDMLIHLAVAIRYKEGDWHSALDEQFNPILVYVLIVSISFTILYSSKFIPTQSFSLIMSLSIVLMALIILVVFPGLMSLFKKPSLRTVF